PSGFPFGPWGSGYSFPLSVNHLFYFSLANQSPSGTWTQTTTVVTSTQVVTSKTTSSTSPSPQTTPPPTPTPTSNTTSSQNVSNTQISNAQNPGNSTHKVPLAAIIGGAVGGVVVLALLVALIFWLRRRRRRREAANVSPSATVIPLAYDENYAQPAEKSERLAAKLGWLPQPATETPSHDRGTNSNTSIQAVDGTLHATVERMGARIFALERELQDTIHAGSSNLNPPPQYDPGSSPPH
ncbi:hypothetical protein H0H93_011657, partial [Arthromyces matolae]